MQKKTFRRGIHPLHHAHEGKGPTRNLETREYVSDTVIISSPHATMYADYFHISPRDHAAGDFGDFRVPGLKLEADYDTELVKTLSRCLMEAKVDGGTGAERMPKLDHGTMVPLRFVQEVMPDVKIIRVGLSGQSTRAHYRFGECVARAAELLNRRVVYVASGDLSHKLKADGPYGFAAEGPVFDKECMAALAAGDFLRLLSIDPELSEGAAECGLRSFWMMAGALDRRKVESEQLSYEGPFGVGYGVASFIVGERDESRAFGDLFEKAQKDRLAELHPQLQALDIGVYDVEVHERGLDLQRQQIELGRKTPDENERKERQGNGQNDDDPEHGDGHVHIGEEKHIRKDQHHRPRDAQGRLGRIVHAGISGCYFKRFGEGPVTLH